MRYTESQQIYMESQQINDDENNQLALAAVLWGIAKIARVAPTTLQTVIKLDLIRIFFFFPLFKCTLYILLLIFKRLNIHRY